MTFRIGRAWGHAQNLSKGEKLPLWRSGRGWLYLPSQQQRMELSAEWYVLKRFTNPGISFGVNEHDHQFSVSFRLPGLGLYCSVDGVLNRAQRDRWLPTYISSYDHETRLPSARDLSLTAHDGALWWCIWMDPDTWRFADPWWRRGSFNPMDWLLGRMDYSVLEEETTEVDIPMPERIYRATCSMKREQWKRPRLPWPSIVASRAHIDIPEGIPEPGKGENAWDCGEDATFGMTCPADTPREGVAKLVESVLRRRQRRGGTNWQPAVKTA